jgi:hypothetical protein
MSVREASFLSCLVQKLSLKIAHFWHFPLPLFLDDTLLWFYLLKLAL